MVGYLFVGAADGGFGELLLWVTVGCHVANAPASAVVTVILATELGWVVAVDAMSQHFASLSVRGSRRPCVRPSFWRVRLQNE